MAVMLQVAAAMTMVVVACCFASTAAAVAENSVEEKRGKEQGTGGVGRRVEGRCHLNRCSRAIFVFIFISIASKSESFRLVDWRGHVLCELFLTFTRFLSTFKGTFLAMLSNLKCCYTTVS
jgi:hypothetical protein